MQIKEDKMKEVFTDSTYHITLLFKEVSKLKIALLVLVGVNILLILSLVFSIILLK